MPLLLELYSGTGSVGKAFQELGWTVFSVDIARKANPSLVLDILRLTPEMLPCAPDFIWASPPCTQYSKARTSTKTPRDLEGADALVRKVLELVDFFKGVPFMMENPQSGLLKTRDVVRGIPMRVLDYCMYGTEYQKRTSIWTNTTWEPSKTLCRYTCLASEGGRKHPLRAQVGRGGNVCLDQLHALPLELCKEIARFAHDNHEVEPN